MRIIEVVYDWPAETFLQRHVQAMQTNAFAPLLVARHAACKSGRSASIMDEASEVSAHILPNFDHLTSPGKVKALRYLVSSPGDALAANRPLRDRVMLADFRRLRPDLIHFHTVTLAAMMKWIPEALGIPYTVSVRGSDVQVQPLQSETSKRSIALALQSAASIHAVCRSLGDTAARLAGLVSDPTTIYTSIPMPEALYPYKPSPGPLHFLSVGRIHWTKAISDLLIALRALLDRGVAADLTLVGSGPDEPRVAWLIQRFALVPNVKMVGKADFGKIRELMANSHALVQSSLAEGLSNSLAEAMAWGCPVFATNVGGTSEVIRHQETGFLLKPLEPQTWAETLALAGDRALMERVRSQAYDVAQQTFSAEHHATKFAAFYREALHRPRPEPYIPCSTRPIPIEEGEASSPPAIVVRGEWRWENGADLVMRALARIFHSKRKGGIVFLGQGPQADELRYLAHVLGLSDSVQFLTVNGSSHGFAAQGSIHSTQVTIDLDSANATGWKVRLGEAGPISVPLGDVKALAACLQNGFVDAG